MLFRRLVITALLVLIGIAPSFAQTAPSLTYGEVWSPAQWMAFMASKIDYPTSLSAGEVLAGPLIGAGEPTWRRLTASDIDGLSNVDFNGLMIAGTPANTTYPATGLVIPDGALAIRGGTTGCADQGVGLSVITDGSVAASGSGLGLAAGINGNCGLGLISIADYGSFDSAAAYLSNDSHAAPITLTNPTYDATHVYPATPLTSTQLQKLSVHMYVLTNSIDGTGKNFGSYVSAWASDGTSITVVGWAALGGQNSASGQLPPNAYQAGTGSGRIAWLGQPTSLFTTNEVCALETNPAVKTSTCTEYDLVNNSGANSTALNGVRILSLGANSVGTGLYLAGQNGNVNSFYRAVWIANFANTGMFIGQTAGSGGVGLDVEMTTGIALNVGDQSGANNFQVDTTGFVSAAGGLAVNGSNAGYMIRAQSGGSSQFLVDTAGNARVGAALMVTDGITAAANAGAVNASYLNVTANLSGTLPAGTGGFALGTNYVAGSSEVDFFNRVAGAGFFFYNEPTSSTATRLAMLDGSGNFTVTGNIGGVAESLSGGLTAGGEITAPSASIAGTISAATGSFTTLNLSGALSIPSLSLAGGVTVGGTQAFGSRLGELIDLYASGSAGYGFGVSNYELTAFIPGGPNYFRLRSGGYAGTSIFSVDASGDLTTAGNATIAGTITGGAAQFSTLNLTSGTITAGPAQFSAVNLADGGLSAPSIGFVNDGETGWLRDASTGSIRQVYKGKQVHAMVPSPDATTPGPPLFVIGDAPNGDENTSVILQHRGYGGGDTSTAMSILMNADLQNDLGDGDGGRDSGAPENGYAVGTTIGLYMQSNIKEPAVRVQAGEGMEYAFHAAPGTAQTMTFDPSGVSFSPSIPVTGTTPIRPRDQMETNTLVPGTTTYGHYVGTITSLGYDGSGNINRINVAGWYGGAQPQITSANINTGNNSTTSGITYTGMPVVITNGAGYKVGDTVSMNTEDGLHAAVFTIQMLLEAEGAAYPGVPSTALGQVMSAVLTSYTGSNFEVPDGRFTQVSTSGSGTGLVLNLNPTLWIDSNNSAFVRNTTCAAQMYYNQSFFGNYCVADEIDLINDLGDVHHYDSSGNATDPLLSINPTDQNPYLIKGIDIISLGNNAINYGIAVLGDAEAGFFVGGARQYGFGYIPTGPTTKYDNNAVGFLSRGFALGSYAFMSWPASGPGSTANPNFSVDATYGDIMTAGSMVFGYGANYQGSIRGQGASTAQNGGVMQYLAYHHDFYDPAGANFFEIAVTGAGPLLSTGGQPISFYPQIVLERGLQVTGGSSTDTLTASGAVSGASVTASGTVSGASLTLTGSAPATLGGFQSLTVSDCGTGASGSGSSERGYVATGSTSVTSCTVTLPSPSPNGYICVANRVNASGAMGTNATAANSAEVTFTFNAAVTSGYFNYHCFN